MSDREPQCALAGCSQRLCTGRAEVLYRLPNFDVLRCRDCRIVFRNPFPDEDELRRIYEDPTYHASVYFSGDPSGKPGPEESIQESVLDRVRDLLPASRQPRLLDVGCGSGRFLARARALGFDVTGIELSRSLAARVSTELGVGVIQGEFTRVDLDHGAFDVVSMWDLLEHTLDPVAALTHARELLSPGGVLLILTIDCSSLFNSLAHLVWRATAGTWTRPLELLYDRRHNYYFDRPTLDRLLSATGFEVIDRRAHRAHLRRWLSDPPGAAIGVAGEIIDAISVVTGRLYRQLLLCRPIPRRKS